MANLLFIITLWSQNISLCAKYIAADITDRIVHLPIAASSLIRPRRLILVEDLQGHCTVVLEVH